MLVLKIPYSLAAFLPQGTVKPRNLAKFTKKIFKMKKKIYFIDFSEVKILRFLF
jgi:hypothetical protein